MVRTAAVYHWMADPGRPNEVPIAELASAAQVDRAGCRGGRPDTMVGHTTQRAHRRHTEIAAGIRRDRGELIAALLGWWQSSGRCGCRDQ